MESFEDVFRLAVLAHMELASCLSPYGVEPPSEELLGHMLALPPSDRAELAEILRVMALEVKGGPGAVRSGEREEEGVAPGP